MLNPQSLSILHYDTPKYIADRTLATLKLSEAAKSLTLSSLLPQIWQPP